MSRGTGPSLTRREVLLGGTVALAWSGVAVVAFGGGSDASSGEPGDGPSAESGDDAGDEPGDGSAVNRTETPAPPDERVAVDAEQQE